MTGPAERFATPLLVAGTALVVVGVTLLLRGGPTPDEQPLSPPVAAEDAVADAGPDGELAGPSPDADDEAPQADDGGADADDGRDVEGAGSPDVDDGAPPPVDDDAAGEDLEALVTGFFAAFSAALADGDDAFLVAHLHPAVGSRYGVETCRAYLSGLPPQQIGFEVLAIGDPAPWTWVAGIDPIEDAITVELRRTIAGEADVVEAHVVVHDGEVAWFTECDA